MLEKLASRGGLHRLNSVFKRRSGASRQILYDGQKRSNQIGMNCATEGTSSRPTAPAACSFRRVSLGNSFGRRLC